MLPLPLLSQPAMNGESPGSGQKSTRETGMVGMVAQVGRKNAEGAPVRHGEHPGWCRQLHCVGS